MSLTEAETFWYVNNINRYIGAVADLNKLQVVYPTELRSDESSVKGFAPEELVHALGINILCNSTYLYDIKKLYHEKYYAHGSRGSSSDEVDLLIEDDDGLPYAIFEFKAAEKAKQDEATAIKNQLFGTARLVGSPKLLVYATIYPNTMDPTLSLKCINYTLYKSYEAWEDAGKPYSTVFPIAYQDLEYVPFVSGGNRDLRTNATQSEFRSVAAGFHNSFFGEHPDNALFINLVKCLLAKIHDERNVENGAEYAFQVKVVNGKQQSAKQVFEIVNNLYKDAYARYIDQAAKQPDEIDPKEFSPEKVKAVVQALESLSITKGAALHGDVIGAFFEEILRAGFKQDKGMYFTHSNLVRFMLEALDLAGLTKETWKKSTHPENRLPYIIDPACGSGAFLLHAMNAVTRAVRDSKSELVSNFEATKFFNARLSEDNPNYWAENFVYGFDPKFIMAITAKVNMVLHGDGSAHMFKYDAFAEFKNYEAPLLRVASESQRSIPKGIYGKEMCETFDVVVSNPPFGVSLSAETKRSLTKAFSLNETFPSDAIFIERAFQLLKPGGRLGLVLPESIFNAVDLMDLRVFLYKMFKIKAIVALPRNAFIDTPTLTSLLFAEKKSPKEIIQWDALWKEYTQAAEQKIKSAKQILATIKGSSTQITPEEICESMLSAVAGLIEKDDWLYKKGKNPQIIPMIPTSFNISKIAAIQYYEVILKSSSIADFITRYAFAKTADKCNNEHMAFAVNEIGYKLSKRKEKAKPNQLMKMVGKNGENVQNIHLCDNEYDIKINADVPETILDFIKRDVVWGGR